MIQFLRFGFIFLALNTSILHAQISHAEARIIFPKAVQDEKTCEKFIKDLENIPENDYLLKAYRGGARIVMAKFTSMPNRRLQYFLDGKEELDLGVEKMPSNVEIRYLRFRIQENTPAMLFYDNNEEDLPIIIERIGDVIDSNYKEKIKTFVIDSGKCSEEQIQRLKKG